MAELRAGSNTAAEEIFRRYAGRLIALARNNLDGRLRQKIDADDVVQSALKSFFHRQADGQFDLGDWDGLWSLLVTITLRKAGHQVERFHAACRDVRREHAKPALEESAASWQALGNEPSPSHAAMLAETVENVLRSLADDRERQIVSMSLQGFDVAEISVHVGRSERTVNRVLERLRHQLERQRDANIA